MDLIEWQERLEKNFTVKGLVGGNLVEVFNSEAACEWYYKETFYPRRLLIDSFQGFYVETLKKALKWVSDHGWPERCEHYSSILVYFVVMFRSFRACEHLFLKGYPFDGYALLRDLKDRAILLSGIAHNITTFSSIFGLTSTEGLSAAKWKEVKKARKHEEKRVLKNIIGEKSGLPPATISELHEWEQLFHEEVHGSRLSLPYEWTDWFETKGPPSIGPTPQNTPMGNYMHRADEIAWLMVRLLPYLQAKKNAFGAEWQKKHAILDDSFRDIRKTSSESGMRIANVFIEFVEEKFSFKTPFYYFEADGSA